MKISLALCLAIVCSALLPGCSVIVGNRRSCDENDLCPDGSVCENGECREEGGDGDGDGDSDGDGDGDGDGDADGDGDGDCTGETRAGTFFITASNIGDFVGVERIDGSLSITGTTLLEEIPELHCLREITVLLQIVGNDALANIHGLDQVMLIGDSLEITDNPMLSSCDAGDLGGRAQLAEADMCIEQNSVEGASPDCEVNAGCGSYGE